MLHIYHCAYHQHSHSFFTYPLLPHPVTNMYAFYFLHQIPSSSSSLLEFLAIKSTLKLATRPSPFLRSCSFTITQRIIELFLPTSWLFYYKLSCSDKWATTKYLRTAIQLLSLCITLWQPRLTPFTALLLSQTSRPRPYSPRQSTIPVRPQAYSQVSITCKTSLRQTWSNSNVLAALLKVNGGSRHSQEFLLASLPQIPLARQPFPIPSSGQLIPKS